MSVQGNPTKNNLLPIDYTLIDVYVRELANLIKAY